MNTPKRALALAGLILATSALISPTASAGTDFLTYQGRDAVQEGRGGNMKVVDGVDFWLDGSPPRRFQILGSIVDERHKTGLIGAMAMSNLEQDIAKRAHAAGGDAVILTDAQDNVHGYVSSNFASASGNGYSAFGNSTGRTRPIESHASRYLVVRYLPDDPALPASAPPPTPPISAPPNSR